MREIGKSEVGVIAFLLVDEISSSACESVDRGDGAQSRSDTEDSRPSGKRMCAKVRLADINSTSRTKSSFLLEREKLG